jgi:hypothetical protein
VKNKNILIPFQISLIKVMLKKKRKSKYSMSKMPGNTEPGSRQG